MTPAAGKLHQLPAIVVHLIVGIVTGREIGVPVDLPAFAEGESLSRECVLAELMLKGCTSRDSISAMLETLANEAADPLILCQAY